MGQHFLLSAAARSLSPAKIALMSASGVENVFSRLRWPQADGKPVCPRCDRRICYDCRRPGASAALALQGVPCRFFHHVGYLVRLAQAAAAELPDGHSDLL
jgi:hypothetical protein